ncbi:hypothetical protein [Gordonia jinghuaiqii]|uniref:hypothetical protein n=1 Tax=Gordonia jinghuaiqii TaxID=2758710 RepID=UPI001CB78F4C|nr:hypothetical protein [Gordonia jinghuaiqii]
MTTTNAERDLAADSGHIERYWAPGDPDFGAAVPPRFGFADPHAAGLFHGTDDRVRLTNRGASVAAATTLRTDGSAELHVLEPGTVLVLPDEDSLTYVQAPRAADGRPVLYGAIWVSSGRVMPVTVPIPTRREFLDQRYLTPWSSDWNGGFADRQLRDAAADGVSFQYRTGGSTFTVHNAGSRWIAVVHRSGTEYSVAECGPGERADFEVSPHAARTEVFSVVGQRVGGSPGRGPYMSASGTVHPGWAGRPGTATAYGSVVVMLGSLVYNALPKRNLYLAFSRRRRGCAGIHR